jgi:hypothetical protein
LPLQQAACNTINVSVPNSYNAMKTWSSKQSSYNLPPNCTDLQSYDSCTVNSLTPSTSAAGLLFLALQYQMANKWTGHGKHLLHELQNVRLQLTWTWHIIPHTVNTTTQLTIHTGKNKTWRVSTYSNTNVMITCLEVTDILKNEIPEFFFRWPLRPSAHIVMCVHSHYMQRFSATWTTIGPQSFN